MIYGPAYPSATAIKRTERQLEPGGRLWFLIHEPTPGASPVMLPEFSAETWAALTENERYGKIYDQQIASYYLPAAQAARTRRRNARRARP